MARDRTLAIGVTAVTALAAVLLLANLGNRYLWQDEAQTALIARTVLESGVPHGTDGRNSFSQELGVEFGPDGIWKWHTWLSFYLVAGSFALLGPTTLAARLPFALCGLATVALMGGAGMAFWRDRRAALAGALLLALSVPFLILSRQCRYYALVSLLSLLGLDAYTMLGRARWAPWGLFAAALLVFHAHYVYAATLLATVLLHALLFERQRLRTTLVVSAVVTLQAIPWIVWFSSIHLTEEKARSFLDLSDTGEHLVQYLRLIFVELFAWGAFLLIPAGFALRRSLRGEPPFALDAPIRSGVALIALYCGVTVLLLALLSPLFYLRYLAPLLPPLFLLAGLCVGRLWRASPAAAAAAVLAFAALGSLRGFLYEISHDYDGPIEGIVRFLEEHAAPGDVVAMVYGDLPVKFYTSQRVVGGLTGEDLAPAADARWIILRQHLVNQASADVYRALAARIQAGGYRRHVLDVPDVAFENREDPQLHHFRTVEGVRPVIVWERIGSIEAPGGAG